MSTATTSIEWTDKTWNPVRGCSIVSPGCVNCYAMRQAHRFSGEGQAYHGLTKRTGAGPQWTGKVVCDEAKLLEPLSWRKPARVFVNSMSDLFHEQVEFAFIDRVFAVMAHASHHTFQILTKRPHLMREYFAVGAADLQDRWDAASDDWTHGTVSDAFPLPNVWLGVSCENQQTADERIPLLLQTPAAIRWVSAEPLLGPILFDNGEHSWLTCHQRCAPFEDTSCVSAMNHGQCFRGVDWVVVGGESGAGARPFDLAWGRSIVRQCQAAGVPVFVKQVGAIVRAPREDALQFAMRGSWRAESPGATHGIAHPGNRKGGDPSEWPEDLRVRAYPTVGPHQ